jgi:hypothetical protein
MPASDKLLMLKFQKAISNSYPAVGRGAKGEVVGRSRANAKIGVQRLRISQLGPCVGRGQEVVVQQALQLVSQVQCVHYRQIWTQWQHENQPSAGDSEKKIIIGTVADDTARRGKMNNCVEDSFDTLSNQASTVHEHDSSRKTLSSRDKEEQQA